MKRTLLYTLLLVCFVFIKLDVNAQQYFFEQDKSLTRSSINLHLLWGKYILYTKVFDQTLYTRGGERQFSIFYRFPHSGQFGLCTQVLGGFGSVSQYTFTDSYASRFERIELGFGTEYHWGKSVPKWYILSMINVGVLKIQSENTDDIANSRYPFTPDNVITFNRAHPYLGCTLGSGCILPAGNRTAELGFEFTALTGNREFSINGESPRVKNIMMLIKIIAGVSLCKN